MYIDFKKGIETMTEIVTRTRVDLSDYQKDMCLLAYIIGKMQGQIDVFEQEKECSIKKEG